MKRIFIVCGIVIILAAGIGIAYWKIYQSPREVPLVMVAEPTTAPVQVENVTWTDPAQFTFVYPKDLTINAHPEDQENYAHVELTSATHSGSIVIWVKDPGVNTIEDWVKKTKQQGAIDTTLGGEPAKKILSISPAKTVTSAAVHDGYLYQIDATLTDSAYWESIYNTVISSFVFTSSSTDTATQPREDTQQSSDEDFAEEVIE